MRERIFTLGIIVMIGFSLTFANTLQAASAEITKKCKPLEGTWRYFSTGYINWCHKPTATYQIKAQDDGTYTATYTDLISKKTITVSRVVYQDGMLRIDHPLLNWYFKGTMSKDGMSIRGTLRQQLKLKRNILVRVDPVTYKLRKRI